MSSDCSVQYPTGRSMPSLSKKFSKDTLDFYRFHFLEDGYPGRLNDDGSIYAHPIYPVYVLNDYLFQLKNSKSPVKLKRAIDLIVQAVLNRVENRAGALFFMYDQQSGVSRATGSHPSGLTQAYYADLFSRLSMVMPQCEKVTNAAEGFYASLSVSTEQGGVARKLHGLRGIEEVPLDQPDLVLNGWLSALKSAMDTADRQGGWMRESFLKENVELLEHMLPEYDHEATLNSRYSLSSAVSIRIQERTKAPFSIHSPLAVYSQAQKRNFTVGRKGHWHNTLSGPRIESSPEKEKINIPAGTATFSLICSRAHDVNALKFDLLSSVDSAEYDLEIELGCYDPFSAAPVRKKWVVKQSIKPKGDAQRVRLAVPPDVYDLVGYPTNFLKSIGGKQRNVYHFIHINRLWQLAQRTGRSAFSSVSKRWAQYALQWDEHPIYKSLDHSYIPEKIPRIIDALRSPNPHTD